MIIIPQGGKADKINLIEAFLKAFLFFSLENQDVAKILELLQWMRNHPGDMNARCAFGSDPNTETVVINLQLSFSNPLKAAN